MDISELTEKMHKFVSSKGWYQESSPRPQNLRNLVISLNIEAAELLELVQWKETIANKKELADEIADVALYLLQIASISGIDLENAILDKLDANQLRIWNNNSQ